MNKMSPKKKKRAKCKVCGRMTGNIISHCRNTEHLHDEHIAYINSRMHFTGARGIGHQTIKTMDTFHGKVKAI